MKHHSLVEAALLAAITVMPTAPVFAAERTAALTGAGLAIVTPCAAQVAILPDATLHGHSIVTAAADHQEELDRLVFDTQGSPRISTGRRDCWRPALDIAFSPTLKLRVQVPPGTPLSINESGVGDYRVGDLGGALSLQLSGAAQIGTGRLTTLKADLSGSGSLTTASIEGSATVEISGSGTVSIGQAQVPALSLDLSGVGSFVIKSGSIGKATLEDSGAGRIQIGATIGDVTASLSGVGSVHLARVTGTIHKDVSGMGSVVVGD